MSDILKYTGDWVGNLYGTHQGLVSARLVEENGQLRIRLRINRNEEIVIAESSFASSFDRPIPFQARLVKEPQNTWVGALEITQAGRDHIQGRWTVDDGSGGVFHIQRALASTTGSPNGMANLNSEVIAADLKMGPLVLFRDEFISLIRTLRQLFPAQPQIPIIIASQTSREERKIQYLEDFLSCPSLPRILGNLQIQMIDTSAAIHKTIFINLADGGESQFTVQSGDRVWTHGTKESLRVAFAPYANRMQRLYKKHGLSINGLLLLFALTFLPEMQQAPRIIFLIIILALIMALYFLHKKISRHKLWTDGTKRTPFLTYRSQLYATLVAAAIATLIPFMAGGFEPGNLRLFVELLRNWFW